MPRIQSPARPAVTAPAARAEAKKPAAAAAQQQEVSKGWGPKAAGVGRPSRPQIPDVATNARAVVESMVAGNKAMSQMEIVASTVQHNQAAEGMVKDLGAELAAQYRDRGNEKAAAKVEKDLSKFLKDLPPVKGYYVDPDRGSMAAVEDNGERSEKLNFKIAEFANSLDKVNAEPAGEYQQAYNAHARGNLAATEARFVGALGEALVNGDEKGAEKALAFLKALPKKVDAQIESRGGTMEPLERSGGAQAALQAYMDKSLR